MAPTPGTRLGPYEIGTQIGAGGMGEVYRATDTRLKRQVAIKILPLAVAADADRLARFQREAEVLASLNHPYIAAIYGLEEADGVKALVMELVEGPTLADRIAQGALPIDEALPIATQIAEALEAAHEQGIIHRDLKPANVKVRPDGTVKVLDFGLAKAMEPAGASSPSVSQSPTITTPAMTQMGVILGTAAYMSPEQAKGRPVDKRSDVWAFGAVLFETLSGRRAFEGEDVSDTLATVLKSEPDWSLLPADVPLHIRVLIQRCLAKDRRHRIADVSIALFVITEGAALGSAAVASSAETVAPARRPLWQRLVMPTAAAVMAGAAVGATVWFGTRPSAGRVTSFALSSTSSTALVVDQVSRDVMITPDGTRVVYQGVGPSMVSAGSATRQRLLYVRALDQLEPTPIEGLGSPRAPFSSPDGQWIGFVDTTTTAILKKVAITGGPAVTLCRLDGQSRGATWGDDGSIVFATSATSTGLQRVSAAGGAPTAVTTPDSARGEGDHLWPQFLPGSMAVLFTITATTGGIDAAQVAVLDLRTGVQKVLLQGGSQAQYVRSGHLVYAAAGTLRAVAFDLPRLEVIGTPVPVVPQVLTLPTDTAEFDVARDDGSLVYVSGSGRVAARRTLVWVDRQGREEAVKGAPARAYNSLRVSPDGTRMAAGVRDEEDDVWVWDFARETLTRITFDPGLDQWPVWTPDGRVVFSSQAGGAAGALFWQAANGTGTADRLTQGTVAQFPSSVSPDGTRILFSENAFGSTVGVKMVTLDKDRPVQSLVQTPFIERNAEISPDGRWLVYQSNDSGLFRIFVRPFPDVNAGRWQVSTGAGVQPVWARNGEELFYLASDGALMSVRIGTGATWTAGIPTRVFAGSYFGGGVTNISRTYDVSPDGKRFLMIKEGDGTGAPPRPPASSSCRTGSRR